MRRRPVWLPLAAAVLAMAVFMLLGLWQLQRAEERRAEFAAISAGQETDPVALPAQDAAIESLAWHSVRIEGRFLQGRDLLLDNRTLHGRAGFDVITPFRLDDGRLVLVDRGWIPADVGSREPAEPVLPAPAVAQQLNGRLWLPQTGIRLGPAVVSDTGWPRLFSRFEFPALEEVLEEALVPAVVRVEQDAAWTFALRPVSPQFGPERHLGYAFQWFALALTVVVVTILLLVRNRRKVRNESDTT